MAIVDPGDDGLERAEQSARASDLNFDRLDLTNLRLRAGLPVQDAIIQGGCSCTRTVEGASTLILTLDDKDMGLLRSGAIDVNQDGNLDPIEVKLDTLRWRLVKAEPNYDATSSELKLTFEERAVDLLGRHDAPLAVSRANLTRAEFAHRLVREVKVVRLAFYSPEEHFAQATAKTPRDKTSRDAQRKPGFADNIKLKIQGQTASADQLREIETSLTVADEEGAKGRARLALIVAGIGESGFRAIRNLQGSKYSGVFQADPANIDPKDTESQARHFLKGGLGYQSGGAIAAAAAHPDWSPGTIAYKVEGSRANFPSDAAAEHHYQVGDNPAHAAIGEARLIAAAWDGNADGGTKSQRTVIKPFVFRRGLPGKRETSWQTLQRIASDVGWRCFVVGDVVYFISEEQLFMGRARAEVSWGDPGFNSISPGSDWDEGKTVAQLKVGFDADRWAFPPGSLIALRDVGAFSGRWLVNTIDRPDLHDPATMITLTKPIPRKREPAADTIQVPRDVTDDAAKGVAAAYAAAKHLADLKIPYKWGGGHGFDLDDYNPTAGLDCSGGVCMVLHRAGMFGDRAVVSGDLEKWGTPGKGRQMTVYANADHVFMVFDLPGKKPQAWEFRHTGTLGGFSDRAQSPGFENGFTARHYTGT